MKTIFKAIGKELFFATLGIVLLSVFALLTIWKAYILGVLTTPLIVITSVVIGIIAISMSVWFISLLISDFWSNLKHELKKTL